MCEVKEFLFIRHWQLLGYGISYGIAIPSLDTVSFKNKWFGDEVA